jgi:hypothetical protein
MSQVVESAHSCQSCQQDLYKSELGSHHVKVGLLILYIVARRSVFSVFRLSLFASEYFGCDLPDCFRIARFYMHIRNTTEHP